MTNGSEVAFGRSICGCLAAAERREWLLTNGLGGFASGTIAGTLTRRYHGLLVAALQPPLERTLLVAKLDETVTYRDVGYALATNRWNDDYVMPCGYQLIERFYLEGTTPVWRYALADALVEKRIWMEAGRNTTFVRYQLLRAEEPVVLQLRAFVNYRDFHGNTHAGDWHINVTNCSTGVRVEAYAGAQPFYLFTDSGDATVENVWYRNFVLVEESRRGLDDRDDHLAAASFERTLATGESVTIAAGVEELSLPISSSAPVPAKNRSGDMEPWWVDQLKLAAEQFIVARPTADQPEGRTIIAGYHWFGDWGRDTMIALPGLTLATGRYEIARQILQSFAPFVQGGMLPNFFPEAGATPEYNTADAALWYVEAAAAYFEATHDTATLRMLWPSLRNVVTSYRDGTRYDIHMDGNDGLIVASAPGVQLTWMDAKVGDWVVTPRMGKPVEIASLWYNALRRMAAMAEASGEPPEEYLALASRTYNGIARFWNDRSKHCYDVLDGPDGSDATLRPNQIFAVSLPHSALSTARQRAVVDACAAQLLTTNGLRTLAPSDERFVPVYDGSPRARDSAYHQGTVWPWLLGPFAIAYARAYSDRERARSFLVPLADQLLDYGLGTISELADGTPPFTPRGAIAQAWSVAEFLRAWNYLRDEV
ncbi:MAG: glycogen debranching enzyme family protein [Candidatus Eremiobacteraeota bacterium]|nr:glycogen debranching enzyme family protein [Candidatus Eremiobacteraeota bacterium]